MSKLTQRQAVNIRRLYANTNLSMRKIAKKYKVNHSVVSRIINFKARWNDTYDKGKRKYSIEFAKKLRKRWLKGESTWQIAESIGDNQTQVWRMVTGQGAYKNVIA